MSSSFLCQEAANRRRFIPGRKHKAASGQGRRFVSRKGGRKVPEEAYLVNMQVIKTRMSPPTATPTPILV